MMLGVSGTDESEMRIAQEHMLFGELRINNSFPYITTQDRSSFMMIAGHMIFSEEVAL